MAAVLLGPTVSPARLLAGGFAEQFVKGHCLEQSIAEFLSSSSAAHLEVIPVLQQQLGGKIYPGNLLRHRIRHQLSDCLCTTGPWLAHHQSEMTPHSGSHHVQNSARNGLVRFYCPLVASKQKYLHPTWEECWNHLVCFWVLTRQRAWPPLSSCEPWWGRALCSAPRWRASLWCRNRLRGGATQLQRPKRRKGGGLSSIHRPHRFNSSLWKSDAHVTQVSRGHICPPQEIGTVNLLPIQHRHLPVHMTPGYSVSSTYNRHNRTGVLH